MGVAVGDYNGDGFPDLYVTQYGRSILYHNNGDGTFTDVTEKAGVAAPGWATSAVWFDYDNDGRLDLFVCRFVDFDKSKNIFAATDLPAGGWYCKPTVLQADAQLAVPQQRRWHVHGCEQGNRDRRYRWQKPGEWLPRTSTTMAGWICSSPMTRLPNFLFANRGKGGLRKSDSLAGVGVQPIWAGAVRHGSRFRRL